MGEFQKLLVGNMLQFAMTVPLDGVLAGEEVLEGSSLLAAVGVAVICGFRAVGAAGWVWAVVCVASVGVEIAVHAMIVRETTTRRKILVLMRLPFNIMLMWMISMLLYRFVSILIQLDRVRHERDSD
jgi:uncharacterized membrane protein